MTKLLLCALLLSYAPATSPFSLSARCRTRTVVAQQAYPQHNNDDAQFNDGRTQATHIARGTTIKADTFASSNPLVIDGELCVAQLDCREEIQISGKVVGNVQGGALVIVDGELEGSVDCEELVVGPAGMVTGAVCCRDLVIRPGGKIGGQLSCENMKSERDVFHNSKSPLPQVVYQSDTPAPRSNRVYESYKSDIPASRSDRVYESYKSDTPNPRTQASRDSEVAALRAMSDRQASYEQVSYEDVRVNKDEYGNPLIGSASDDQVKSLRKNREEMAATRNFLDRATSPKPKYELPDWVLEDKPKKKSPPTIFNQRSPSPAPFRAPAPTPVVQTNYREEPDYYDDDDGYRNNNRMPDFLQ